MTGRSICLLSLHFSALKLYSPLFLSCFSPLDSPWKYKFPLECLFKWMLYLFNSYTRNLEICFFFHSRRIFWQVAGVREEDVYSLVNQMCICKYLVCIKQYRLGWETNVLYSLIFFFFLQKDVPEKTYAFMCVQLL